MPTQNPLLTDKKMSRLFKLKTQPENLICIYQPALFMQPKVQPLKGSVK
jgi:hypothetical protein